MAKILIETTGEFELLDFGQSGLVVRADRPTVSVDNSHFISSRAAIGQVKTLATLSDDATDEEFEKYWNESKSEVVVAENATDEEKAQAQAEAVRKQKELAVASFSDSFSTGEKSLTEEDAKTEQEQTPASNEARAYKTRQVK